MSSTFFIMDNMQSPNTLNKIDPSKFIKELEKFLEGKNLKIGVLSIIAMARKTISESDNGNDELMKKLEDLEPKVIEKAIKDDMDFLYNSLDNRLPPNSPQIIKAAQRIISFTENMAKNGFDVSDFERELSSIKDGKIEKTARRRAIEQKLKIIFNMHHNPHISNDDVKCNLDAILPFIQKATNKGMDVSEFEEERLRLVESLQSKMIQTKK